MNNKLRISFLFTAVFACLQVKACLGAPAFNVKDDSPFGICVDKYECSNEKTVQLMKNAGIRWARQVFYLNLIEPEKGKFSWGDTDGVIENMYKNGINAYGMFLMWKTWCDPVTGGDESIKDWTDFVTAVIARYKDKIKYWEIWNEEDYEGFWKPTSAAAYSKFLKATYLSAKKADPDCKIILGGLMGWGGKYTCFPFIDEIYKYGSGAYFDIAALHPYTMPDDPQKNNLMKEKIKDFIGRMKKYNDPGKPIWITEIGWPGNKPVDPASDRGVTPAQQADYLVKTLEICLSYPQIKKVFWYCLRDTGVDPLDSDQHYGILNNDLTPKPSYDAYRDFILKWKK